ncbi:MAG: EamA family transporter [Acidimicrobiia bacterium]|nr:EamA family transporter [Acidimicrobiia bacterium]
MPPIRNPSNAPAQATGSIQPTDSYVRPHAARGLVLAGVSTVLFAVVSVAIFDLFSHHNALELTFRMNLAGFVIFLIIGWWRKALHPRGQLRTLLLLGVCVVAATVMYYVSLSRLGPGPSATFAFVMVPTVLIWTQIKQGIPVPGRAWAAAGIVCLGVSLATQTWTWERADPIGIVAGFGSAACMGGYLLLVDRLRALSPVTVGVWFRLSAALMVLPLSGIGPTDLPLSKWLVLGIAAAASAVGILLEIASVGSAGPGTVGTVLTAQPVVSSAVAWVALGESLTWMQIVGIGVVMLGGLTLHGRPRLKVAAGKRPTSFSSHHRDP